MSEFNYTNTPFSIRVSDIPPEKQGEWGMKRIEVLKNGSVIGEYTRNYDSFISRTFYPFLYRGEWFALYSEDYTATRIARLTNSFEDWCGEKPKAFGFCPTEFWVPRFRSYFLETNYGEKKSTSYFDRDFKTEQDFFEEKGTGQLLEEGYLEWGLLSGCYWGDDSSWKIRYIDLSRLHEKQFSIQEKFGYWEMVRNVQTLRECVDIYGEGKLLRISGDFFFDMKKDPPNESFAKDFFSTNLEEFEKEQEEEE